MGSAKPVLGRCNARRADNTFCTNWPDRSIDPAILKASGIDAPTRCKHHGGPAQIRKKLSPREWYERDIMRRMKSPEDVKAFKRMPRDTDLSTEIAQLRMQIRQYEAMLAETPPRETILGSVVNPTTGTVAAQNVRDLRDRATSLLNTLTRSQHDMHPEAAKGGQLTLTISLDAGAQAAEPSEVPDLEAEGGRRDDAEDEPEAERPVPKADDKPDHVLGDEDA